MNERLEYKLISLSRYHDSEWQMQCMASRSCFLVLSHKNADCALYALSRIDLSRKVVMTCCCCCCCWWWRWLRQTRMPGNKRYWCHRNPVEDVVLNELGGRPKIDFSLSAVEGNVKEKWNSIYCWKRNETNVNILTTDVKFFLLIHEHQLTVYGVAYTSVVVPFVLLCLIIQSSSNM